MQKRSRINELLEELEELGAEIGIDILAKELGRKGGKAKNPRKGFGTMNQAARERGLETRRMRREERRKAGIITANEYQDAKNEGKQLEDMV